MGEKTDSPKMGVYNRNNNFVIVGLVVTDWNDIERLVFYHKVAPTPKDAVRMSVEAGIDMSMVPSGK
jgi:beta-glucosidase